MSPVQGFQWDIFGPRGLESVECAHFTEVAVAANFGVLEPRVGTSFDWRKERQRTNRLEDTSNLPQVWMSSKLLLPHSSLAASQLSCVIVATCSTKSLIFVEEPCAIRKVRAKALILTFLGAAYHAYGYVQLRNAQKQVAGNADWTCDLARILEYIWNNLLHLLHSACFWIYLVLDVLGISLPGRRSRTSIVAAQDPVDVAVVKRTERLTRRLEAKRLRRC